MFYFFQSSYRPFHTLVLFLKLASWLLFVSSNPDNTAKRAYTLNYTGLRSFDRRRTTAAAMMDDFDGGEDATTTGGPRTGNHQWATSADIVEYDSSTAANTPTLQQHQQQHTQLLLPQQQQRSYKFPQKAGAAHAANSTVSYGDKAAAIVSATAAQESANGRATAMKWKTRALYAFLACLLAVVVINLTLTLWFIRVTQFTSVIHMR